MDANKYRPTYRKIKRKASSSSEELGSSGPCLSASASLSINQASVPAWMPRIQFTGM
jgi:hypothetical protein